jgi:hypothetical protein
MDLRDQGREKPQLAAGRAADEDHHPTHRPGLDPGPSVADFEGHFRQRMLIRIPGRERTGRIRTRGIAASIPSPQPEPHRPESHLARAVEPTHSTRRSVDANSRPRAEIDREDPAANRLDVTVAAADPFTPKFQVGIRMPPANQERLMEDSPCPVDGSIIMDVHEQWPGGSTCLGESRHQVPVHGIILGGGDRCRARGSGPRHASTHTNGMRAISPPQAVMAPTEVNVMESESGRSSPHARSRRHAPSTASPRCLGHDFDQTEDRDMRSDVVFQTLSKDCRSARTTSS